MHRGGTYDDDDDDMYPFKAAPFCPFSASSRRAHTSRFSSLSSAYAHQPPGYVLGIKELY